MRLWFLLLLLAPGAAFAGYQDREAGITLGQEIVLGSQSSHFADSPAFYAYFYRRYDLLYAWGLELGRSIGHTNRGHLSTQELGDIDSPADGKPDTLNFKSAVKTTVTRLTPQFKIGKSDEDAPGGFRPYAILGGGLYLIQNKAGAATLSSFTTGGVNAATAPLTAQISKRNEFDLGFNLGVGFTAKWASSLEVAGDLRYHYVFLHGGATLYLLTPGAKFNFLF